MTFGAGVGLPGTGVTSAMLPLTLKDRLDILIDDLILDGGVEAASLASILLAAKDSVQGEYHVTLSRLVWLSNNELQVGPDGDAAVTGTRLAPSEF
jgi:hypothetical protein